MKIRETIFSIIHREKRKSLFSFLIANEDNLINAIHEFNELLTYQTLYFNGFLYSKWKIKYVNIFDRIDNNVLENCEFDNALIMKAKLFLRYYQEGETLRNNYNLDFLENELVNTKKLFDDFYGYTLDIQQRKAVIKNEDCALVIAGAGTGKTLTITAKVAYLISRYNVKPTELQLISFTTKACDEMRDRIQGNLGINVNISTFHKFGLDIIKKVNDISQPIVCDLSEKQLTQLLQSILDALVENEVEFRELVVKYFLSYLKPYKAASDFSREGDYINYLKDNLLYGYKIVTYENEEGSVISYRERYKSYEELEIANFLLFNSIEFIYEENYKFNTANTDYSQYKPDFYLPKYDLYIEHFGIDRQGNVPNWFKGSEDKTPKQKYQESINWKRNIHKTHGTHLIETYSWMKQEDILIESLTELLKMNGVELIPLSSREIWDVINNEEVDEISYFNKLIHNFLTLFKSKGQELYEIENQLINDGNDYETQRKRVFLGLFKSIYDEYEKYLKSKNEIDFSDMINLATEYVREERFVPTFKYILVDEFQDISIDRYRLLISILNRYPEIKFFGVGDDWQSIFRFSGSDIGIFTQFDDFFGNYSLQSNYTRETTKDFIEVTYRFGKSLIDLSADFILKNQNQVYKQLISTMERTIGDPYTIINSNSKVLGEEEEEEEKSPLVRILDDIKDKSNQEETTIMFLGRYNFDISFFQNIDEVKLNWNKKSNCFTGYHRDYPDLPFKFLTVHKAKGLEADYVILLNLKSGKLGFPSEIVDDPILGLVLSGIDNYPNSEERRVFYVALTRAKKRIYFLIDNQRPSKFIKELLGESIILDRSNMCSKCETGILEVKEGKFGKFLGCSNYPFCTNTKQIFTETDNKLETDFSFNTTKNRYAKCAIKSCNGRLEKRLGKYGYFLGCSNFPKCNYTTSLKE